MKLQIVRDFNNMISTLDEERLNALKFEGAKYYREQMELAKQ